MTVEDRWEQLETLVRDTNSSTSLGEEFRKHFLELLKTPEGPTCLRRHVAMSPRDWVGSPEWERFMREVLLAFGRPEPALEAVPPSDRQGVLRTMLDRSRPEQDRVHWELLWLLHREGHPEVGRLVEKSLLHLVSAKE